MASTIDDKKKTAAVADTATQGAPETAQSSAASPYAGLAGLSDGTKQQLGQLGGGYKPSESVSAAQQYLQNVVSGKPGAYQSQYKGQLESLYNQVMNRDPFQFNLNGDALYNQYRDQYMQQGKQAMMDTMGQAAALTGGYGNSYAQTAGQQTYQQYLTQLNNIVPELYQQAWERYNQEGDALRDKLSMTQGLEDSEYGKYRDQVTDWNSERAHASDEYWNQYNADYSNYANMLNYWNTLAQQENAQYNTNREMAYSKAMAILQSGKMPSDELLAAAGISAADAKSLKKGGSGGGSGSRSSGTGGNTNAPPVSENNASKPATSEFTQAAKSVYQSLNNALEAGRITYTQAEASVKKQVEKGLMTPSEANKVLSRLGI